MLGGWLCRYNHSGVTALRFEADYSGLMHFTTAECVVEVEVVEDKIIEVGVLKRPSPIILRQWFA